MSMSNMMFYRKTKPSEIGGRKVLVFDMIEIPAYNMYPFYYDPVTREFSNGFAHKKSEKGLELDDIWQSTFHDMLIRLRKWIVEENSESRVFLSCIEENNVSRKLYPILSDDYICDVEKAWKKYIGA